MNREGQSKIIEAIFAEMAKKEDKPKDEKEQALSVLDRFKQPKHKLHVKKHVEKLEKGHEPKKVLKDFFKDLRKVSSNDEIENIMKVKGDGEIKDVKSRKTTVKLDSNSTLEIESGSFAKKGPEYKISIQGIIVPDFTPSSSKNFGYTQIMQSQLDDMIKVFKDAWIKAIDV
jgi:hypothetical protein